MEPAEAGHAAADQIRMARDATTSPADFAAGFRPYPMAALTLPQALGRFLQKTSLPPCPCPGRFALSFRRRAFLGREVLRRLSAPCRISVYVMRRRRRSDRFSRNRRHFVYVTFRIRFAAARAGRADRVGRPPILNAMIVRQEAAAPGLPRITALPSFRAYDRGAVFGSAFIVVGYGDSTAGLG
jgi:hypothetical protein